MKSNLELDGFNKQIEQFVWDDKNLLRNSCIKPAKGPDGNKKFGLKWTLKKHEKMKDAQSIDYICENLEDVTKLSTHQKLSCKATASEEIKWILFSLIVWWQTFDGGLQNIVTGEVWNKEVKEIFQNCTNIGDQLFQIFC